MKILTANRLTDGIAVWRTVDGAWVAEFAAAAILRDAGIQSAFEAAGKADVVANLVIDVNLIDVDEVNGKVEPRRLRERIRAFGPTVSVNIGIPAQADLRRAA